LVGTLPMLPWLRYLATEAVFRPGRPSDWMHILEGKFWTRWLLEPLGFGLDYSLGKDFVDFLAQPVIAGRPTWLALLLHLAIGAIGLMLFVRAGRRFWRSSASWRQCLTGCGSPTALTVQAALWGFGLLLTFSTLPIHRHYMLVLFPLSLVWLARLALADPSALAAGRRCLAALVVLQALISLQFLTYIHQHGPIQGDFGTPYASQVQPAGQTAD
jgi:hypothetical protein